MQKKLIDQKEQINIQKNNLTDAKRLINDQMGDLKDRMINLDKQIETN